MKLKQTFFGKQLKKILFEKSLSQQDLANKLGVGQQMISFWITGRRMPTVESISKVSAALDMPINYFIENAGYIDTTNKTSLDDKDIKILQLEKENLELKLQIEKLKKNK